MPSHPLTQLFQRDKFKSRTTAAEKRAAELEERVSEIEEELKSEREQSESHIDEINELIVINNELREELRVVREAHEFEGGASFGLLGGSLSEQLDADEQRERLEVGGPKTLAWLLACICLLSVLTVFDYFFLRLQ